MRLPRILSSSLAKQASLLAGAADVWIKLHVGIKETLEGTSNLVWPADDHVEYEAAPVIDVLAMEQYMQQDRSTLSPRVADYALQSRRFVPVAGASDSGLPQAPPKVF